MSNDQQIQQVEVTIQQLKEIVEVKNAILRLEQNRDFKKIFLEGYFKEEAARLALLTRTGNPQIDVQEVFKDIEAIGGLASYLRNKVSFGMRAEEDLAEHQELATELETEAQSQSE